MEIVVHSKNYMFQ